MFVATNVAGGRLAEHELLGRHRARFEDRIRCAKDSGPRNLPSHGFAADHLWLEMVALAGDLARLNPARPHRHPSPDLGTHAAPPAGVEHLRPRLATHPAAATRFALERPAPRSATPAPPTQHLRPRHLDYARGPRQTRSSTTPSSSATDVPAGTPSEQDHKISRLAGTLSQSRGVATGAVSDEATHPPRSTKRKDAFRHSRKART